MDTENEPAASEEGPMGREGEKERRYISGIFSTRILGSQPSDIDSVFGMFIRGKFSVPLATRRVTQPRCISEAHPFFGKAKLVPISCVALSLLALRKRKRR